MSKIRRGDRSNEGEPLSAGRVEYLEAARARSRAKNIRRTVIIVAVLTIVILFATGVVGSSISRAGDLVDSVHIALTPASGWPQQTGITDPSTVVQMSGSFVELGGDSCTVYSLKGTKLNSIQSGYARPAVAVGKTRFVLYNRSGNELRVESRTQNLYTKTMENTIYLCAVANAGQVAVACGGGGIPVFCREGELVGADAVIDKDNASCLLADKLDADFLVILTAVEKVAIHFGKPDQKWLDELTVEQAKE